MPPACALWRRLDDEGHDAVRTVGMADGWALEGVAVFRHEGRPACLHYRTEIAPDGGARSGAVTGFVGDQQVRIAIERRHGSWFRDGARVDGLDDLLDLDLGFTPSTNLPLLRRLRLAVGEAREVAVVWCDPGVAGLVRLPQRYERTAPSAVAYASPLHGYAATLTLDADGFVACYPRLWQRVGANDPRT